MSGQDLGSNDEGGISLHITNSSEQSVGVNVLDAYSARTFTGLLATNYHLDHDWTLRAFHG